MTPNLKLQEAIPIIQDVLSDMKTLQQIPEPDYSNKHPKIMVIEALDTLISAAQSIIAGKYKTYKEWTMLEEGDDCVMFCSEVAEHKEKAAHLEMELFCLQNKIKSGELGKPKPSGEVTKIARTANNEIIAITYEGKQYYPKELHPAVTISDNDMTIAYMKGVEDGKDSVKAKQMTVEGIEKIIGNFGMFEYDYEGDYYKLSFNDFMKISPQKLQDFLDKHPTFIKALATALFEAVYGGRKE
jgi:hypothetical protein